MELFILFLLAVIMPDSRNVTGIELREPARRQIKYIFKIIKIALLWKALLDPFLSAHIKNFGFDPVVVVVVVSSNKQVAPFPYVGRRWPGACQRRGEVSELWPQHSLMELLWKHLPFDWKPEETHERSRQRKAGACRTSSVRQLQKMDPL